jgi:hypothetical protein
VWGGGHLPPSANKEQLQGVRGRKHLLPSANKKPMQGVQWGEHLPPPAQKEPMQGVRGGGNLPAPAHKKQMQGVWGWGQATRARRRGGGGRWIGKETATCQASSDPAAALIDARDQSLVSDKLVALAVASLSLLQPSSKLGLLGEISSLCQLMRCKQQLLDRRIVKDGVTWKANGIC